MLFEREVISRKRLNLAELCVMNSHRVQDLIFYGCLFTGPCVVAIPDSQNVFMNNCTFNDPAAMFIAIDEMQRNVFVGPVELVNIEFTKCEFRGVGMLCTAAQREGILRTFGIDSFSELPEGVTIN